MTPKQTKQTSESFLHNKKNNNVKHESNNKQQ